MPDSEFGSDGQLRSNPEPFEETSATAAAADVEIAEPDAVDPDPSRDGGG